MTTLNITHAVAATELLGEHLLRCAQARGRWYHLHCIVEAVDAFLAPRFVTTLALTLLVLAGASLAT